MYTETELRDALQHSAADADELITETPPAVGAARHEHPRRRRIGLPTAAAAAVVAAVGAGVLVTHATAGTGSAQGLGTRTGSVVPVSTAAVTSSPAGSRPRTQVSVRNLVTIGERRAHPGYSLGAATGPETVDVDGGDILVIALPASVKFDPATRMTGAQRVDVAGTRGYYGKVIPDPLHPDRKTPDPKTGPPRATLAWAAANGTWIFIRSGNNTVNLSLPKLLSVYRGLHLTPDPARLRVPFQATWLPAGLTLTAADIQPAYPAPVIELTSGKKRVVIQVFPPNSGIRPGPPIGDAPSVYSHPHGFWVMVDADGYSKATAQRILDHLDLSRLQSDDSTWWTVADAVNG